MRRHLYDEIARTLRIRIHEDAYPQGRLPSERELCEEFHVQRDTVRRALEVLEAENSVLRRGRSGTYIAGFSPSPSRRSAATGEIVFAIRRSRLATSTTEVLRGLSQAAESHGRTVLWVDTLSSVNGILGGLPTLVELERHRAAAIAIWPELPADVSHLRRLRERFPLILMDRQIPGFESAFAGFDDMGAGRSMAEHLIGLGRTRIGFASAEPAAQSVQDRLQGAREALRDAGIPMSRLNTLHYEGGWGEIPADLLRIFLRKEEPLQAVMCANDTVAAHLITRLQSIGCRVPDDVAVTGFGNSAAPILDALGLTTMAQGFEELGRAAGDLLLGGRTIPTQETRLTMRLVVRRSCGSLTP